MAFSNDYKYVDLAGLTEFKTKLLAKLADNSASSYTVKHSLESDKLATSRTISLSGDASGSVSFNGSANANIAVTIADVVASTSGAGGSHGMMTAAQAEKLAGLEAGGQVNVIETVKVNGTALTVTSKAVDILVATGSANGNIAVNGVDVAVKGLGSAAYVNLVNNLTTAEAGSALDASQGKALADRVANLEARGRYLSIWYCDTGLPADNPPKSALVSGKYNYKSGDYYIVGRVSSATPAVNYRPDGSYYEENVASTTVETNTRVVVGDFYLYNGTDWKLFENTQKTIIIAQVEGLQTELDAKVLKTQKVNGHALSGDVTVTGSDVALTGYAKGSSSAAIAATDTINAAFGKVENQISKEASDRDTAITTAINDLDASVGSTTVAENKHVAVQVVETNGKLTGCTVTESDIASAALLGTTSDTKDDVTAFGYIKKEAADRAAAITSAVAALDATVTQAAAAANGQLALTVVETDGKLTSVSGSITANTYDAYGSAAVVQGDTTETVKSVNDKVATLNGADTVDGSVAKKIKTAINALGASVGSTTVATDKHVAVQVVEADGKLTGCTVTESDIASAALLGSTSDTASSATAFGYIKKEAADRAAAIQALDAEFTLTAANNNGLAMHVKEVDGIITEFTGSIQTASQSEIDGLFA